MKLATYRSKVSLWVALLYYTHLSQDNLSLRRPALISPKSRIPSEPMTPQKALFLEDFPPPNLPMLESKFLRPCPLRNTFKSCAVCTFSTAGFPRRTGVGANQCQSETQLFSHCFVEFVKEVFLFVFLWSFPLCLGCTWKPQMNKKLWSSVRRSKASSLALLK